MGAFDRFIYMDMLDPMIKKRFVQVVLVIISLGLFNFPPNWVNFNIPLFNVAQLTIGKILGFLSIIFVIWLNNRGRGI